MPGTLAASPAATMSSTPTTAETAVHISTDFWRWAGISTFRIRGVDEEMKKKDTP
ncbi:hypothetical protein SRABI128_06398 [Microbacterium sp. Bi128]|nr:hypothetical protein SRABI128_06398 [Microbacterium sp. Bi128]